MRAFSTTHLTGGRLFQAIAVPTAIAASVIGTAASQAQAASLTPVNLDDLDLGAKIVGPVGPEVETTFVNGDGVGIGDLVSSVSCPIGLTTCLPPQNPAGTIYTYIHSVTPGVDLPNDPPFPAPDEVIPLDNAEAFRLNFPAVGFNGVAGFSFSEAQAALSSTEQPVIEQAADGSLVWRTPTGWESGQPISFFWQTTQNPSGPGGSYGLAGSGESGTAAGPLPTPVAPPPPATEVPEPGAIAPLALLGMGLLLKRQWR